MHIQDWWPRLTADAQTWLIDHNGEPLEPAITAQILSITGGSKDPSFWAGNSTEGQTELTDTAVDWIESVANAESD